MVNFAQSSIQLALALVLSAGTGLAHAQAEAPGPTEADRTLNSSTASRPLDQAIERVNPEAMMGQLVNSIDMGAVATMLERSLQQAASGQGSSNSDPTKTSAEAQAQAEAVQKQMAAQMQTLSRSLMLALTSMIRPMLMGLQAEMRESFKPQR